MTPAELVAHRGLPASHPENTLAGLQAAVTAGALYVEFDLQQSADGVPFLLHDATLERTTARHGEALALSWAELAAIEAHEPARFGERHRGVQLPSLAQVAAWLAHQPQVTAFAEIKEESLYRFGVEQVTTAVLRALAPVKRQTVILSFAAECLPLARGWRTGWVVSDPALPRVAADYLFVEQEIVTDFPPWPGQWVVYDLNSREEAQAWLRRGAHLVETSDFRGVLGR